MAQDRTLRPAAAPVEPPWLVATALLALFAIAILAQPGVARLAPLVVAIAAAWERRASRNAGLAA